MSSIERLGWGPFFENQRERDVARLHVARVVEEQRGQYRLSGDFDGWAVTSGRLRHQSRNTADRPVVGDWVGVAAEIGAERGVIQHRFERRGAVSRHAAGTRDEEQVLAANVDTIFLVTALTRDLNPNRLERYLTLVWQAGALPVVVLSKADLCEDSQAAADEIRSRLAFVDVATVSALQAEGGLAELEPYLRPAQTVALLGSSGVGKSTIVNRLLGRDVLKVSAIREADGRGRHTTTSRQLVELSGGVLLIDTPGLREVQLWGREEAVDAAFEDITTLARECRFGDCAHAGEPGCAVTEAVARGEFDAARLEHYRRLVRETAFEERKRDPSAAAEHKRQWKKIHQAQRTMYKRRDRS